MVGSEFFLVSQPYCLMKKEMRNNKREEGEGGVKKSKKKKKMPLCWKKVPAAADTIFICLTLPSICSKSKRERGSAILNLDLE